jgi:hypothetical protein
MQYILYKLYNNTDVYVRHTKIFFLTHNFSNPRQTRRTRWHLARAGCSHSDIGSSPSIILRPVLHIHSSIMWWIARQRPQSCTDSLTPPRVLSVYIVGKYICWLTVCTSAQRNCHVCTLFPIRHFCLKTTVFLFFAAPCSQCDTQSHCLLLVI